MKRNAVVYARISQDREGAGLGVERQLKECRALAKRLGWSIVAEHADNDISAYSGKARPGYRDLLALLESGKASAVIAWHTDRLHRSPRELEEYVDICERNHVVTQTVRAGELDLATPSGRAVARTVGAWARFESEHKSDRIKAAHAQAAEAGRWRGGGRPFGWQVNPDGTARIDRAEARQIRVTADQLLAGASFHSQVKRLNAAGVRTARGGQWNYTNLRQVLLRPKNAGLSELQGEVVGRMNGWPPILTEDAWRAVVALLTDPSRRKSQDNRVKWMLAGIALCGKCGGRMISAHTGGSANRHRVVYRCTGDGTRGHAARDAERVDAYVSAIVIGLLNRDDWRSVLAPPEQKDDGLDLAATATALRARLGEAADSFADGAITGAQLARITERVKGQLADVEAQQGAGARSKAVAELVGAADPAAVWEGLDIDRKRSFIRDVMTVKINPTGRGVAFGPGVVEIRWREANA